MAVRADGSSLASSTGESSEESDGDPPDMGQRAEVVYAWAPFVLARLPREPALRLYMVQEPFARIRAAAMTMVRVMPAYTAIARTSMACVIDLLTSVQLHVEQADGHPQQDNIQYAGLVLSLGWRIPRQAPRRRMSL